MSNIGRTRKNILKNKYSMKYNKQNKTLTNGGRIGDDGKKTALNIISKIDKSVVSFFKKPDSPSKTVIADLIKVEKTQGAKIGNTKSIDKMDNIIVNSFDEVEDFVESRVTKKLINDTIEKIMEKTPKSVINISKIISNEIISTLKKKIDDNNKMLREIKKDIELIKIVTKSFNKEEEETIKLIQYYKNSHELLVSRLIPPSSSSTTKNITGVNSKEMTDGLTSFVKKQFVIMLGSLIRGKVFAGFIIVKNISKVFLNSMTTTIPLIIKDNVVISGESYWSLLPGIYYWLIENTKKNTGFMIKYAPIFGCVYLSYIIRNYYIVKYEQKKLSS
jgi:hypothetical protein